MRTTLLATIALFALALPVAADGVNAPPSVSVTSVPTVTNDLAGPQLAGSVADGVKDGGTCYGCKPPPPPSSVPGPLLGGGLPGIVAGIGALWAFARRRRANA